MSITESIVETAALEWFGDLGYAIGHGPDLAPGEASAERESFGDVGVRLVAASYGAAGRHALPGC